MRAVRAMKRAVALDSEGPDTESPELYLWRAVVAQAINDALLPIRRIKPASRYGRVRDLKEINRLTNVENRERGRAQEWLLAGDRDFRMVCDMAGLDPDAVHVRCQELCRAGWPTPRGKKKVHRMGGRKQVAAP